MCSREESDTFAEKKENTLKVPKPLVAPMKLTLKLSIPLTYVFMVVGALFAAVSLIKLEWEMLIFSLAFIGFAVFNRFYCMRMLESIERTGTTYKWRWKIDNT